MAPSSVDDAETCDVFVVGAGLAGLAAALGFARAGRRVVSAGPAERIGRGRTVALLGPSVDFLDRLGVWPSVAPRAAAMRGLRIVDDTGSLFAPPPLAFHASEIGRDVFGWNVENAGLADALEAAAAAQPDLDRVTANVAAASATAATLIVRATSTAIVAGGTILKLVPTGRTKSTAVATSLNRTVGGKPVPSSTVKTKFPAAEPPPTAAFSVRLQRRPC